MNFDKLKIAKNYIQGRKLNPNAVGAWKEAILKYVDASSIRQILDLGCGTGRFFPFLRLLFPNAKIIGVDPSKEMLAEAKSAIRDESVEFKKGAGENIPLENESVDLVFMCMMYHTLTDPGQAVKEIARVLRANGLVVLKQVTVENNDQHEFFKFFPESLSLAKDVVPERKKIETDFLNGGFIKKAFKIITYKVEPNYKKYFERISQRGISVLKRLPDVIWEKRLPEFANFCESHAMEGPVMDNRDLFVFQKVAD